MFQIRMPDVDIVNSHLQFLTEFNMAIEVSSHEFYLDAAGVQRDYIILCEFFFW